MRISFLCTNPFFNRILLLEQNLWKWLPFLPSSFPTNNLELLFGLFFFSLQRNEGGMNGSWLSPEIASLISGLVFISGA